VGNSRPRVLEVGNGETDGGRDGNGFAVSVIGIELPLAHGFEYWCLQQFWTGDGRSVTDAALSGDLKGDDHSARDAGHVVAMRENGLDAVSEKGLGYCAGDEDVNTVGMGLL